MGKGCNAEVKKVLKPTRGRPAKRKFETSTLSYSGVTESASGKESVVVARTSSRGRGRRKVTLSVHPSLSDSNVSDDAVTPVETQSKCSSAHECSNINNNPEVCAEKICNGFIKKYQKSYNYNENFASGSETASNMNSKIVENGDHRLNKSPTELNTKSSIESSSSPSCPTTVECNSPTAPATGNNYLNSNVQQQSTPVTTDDVQTQSSLVSPSLTSGDVPLKKRRLRDVVIKDDDGFVIPSPYLIPTQIFQTNNFNDRDTNINNSNKLETTAIYKPDAMTNSSNNNESTNIFDYSTTNNDAKDIVKSIPDDSTTTTTITKTYDPVTDSLTSQTAVEINKKSNGLLLGAHVLYT
ncbi:hypothetical protein HELRODRAFT_192378, partial [Helobdella robusta]|uniref:Uncharacterized protein n=1 Tax=Helobdella robusta TaxID=6412 RepID=T1FTV8_HELRO